MIEKKSAIFISTKNSSVVSILLFIFILLLIPIVLADIYLALTDDMIFGSYFVTFVLMPLFGLFQLTYSFFLIIYFIATKESYNIWVAPALNLLTVPMLLIALLLQSVFGIEIFRTSYSRIAMVLSLISVMYASVILYKIWRSKGQIGKKNNTKMASLHNLMRKLNKISIYLLFGTLFFFIAFVVILIVDYSSCPPEIMDIVVTCHEKLFWPLVITTFGFELLLVIAVPLFLITKFVLWKMPKRN